jgi:hypothetical protein
MKTHTVLCTLLLAALSVGACDKGDKKSDEKKTDEAATKTEETPGAAKDEAKPAAAPPAADTTATTPSATTPSATTPSVGTSAIEILSEGSEPRHQLKYQAPAGTKQKMEMSMDITMDVPMMGKMSMPTMVMVADVEVLSVAADGKITNKMTFTDAKVKDTKDSMPGLADALKEPMSKIKGTSTTMVIEPSGKVVSMEVDAPNDPMLEQTMGQTKQGLDQMVAQLPDKPVGKGAKWRVKQTVEQGGMKIDQTIDFEVMAITDKTAKIKGVAVLTAPKQEMKQQGMSVTLEKLDGSGTTDLDIDFTKVVPSVDGKIDMDMKAGAMGQSQEMKMSMSMKIRAK